MSKYQDLSFRITGVAAMLMHNGQLADPLNPHSRAIAELTSKRHKTESEHKELSRREFFGGLYVDGGEPCIPGEMMEAVLVRAAMKSKRGPNAKAGLIVERNARLEYEGPREPNALWNDERFQLRVPVKVGLSKVMRTRPRFDNWAAEITVSYHPSLLNASDINKFLIVAGEQIGIGDWRPRFGRFVVGQ